MGGKAPDTTFLSEWTRTRDVLAKDDVDDGIKYKRNSVALAFAGHFAAQRTTSENTI